MPPTQPTSSAINKQFSTSIFWSMASNLVEIIFFFEILKNFKPQTSLGMAVEIKLKIVISFNCKDLN
jgi:hypothetical protein